jgi:hypothetical protein
MRIKGEGNVSLDSLIVSIRFTGVGRVRIRHFHQVAQPMKLAYRRFDSSV